MASNFPSAVDTFTPHPPVDAFDDVKGSDVGALQDALIATQTFLRQLAPSYISGLKMKWVSATALTVNPGVAFTESGEMLNATTSIAKTGLTLSASTWYHVYIYNNSGTVDIEIVTTAPASPYAGVARSKTGSTSRRYVGSVKTDGSGNLYAFIHNPATDTIAYVNNQGATPFRVLNGGTATTETNVDCSGVIPVTAFFANMKLSNLATNKSLVVGNSEDNITLGSGVSVYAVNPLNYPNISNIPLDSSQRISYMFVSATPDAGAYFDVYGYAFER